MLNYNFLAYDIRFKEGKRDFLKLLHEYGFSRKYEERLFSIEFSMKKNILRKNRDKGFCYRIQVEHDSHWLPYRLWVYLDECPQDLELFKTYKELFETLEDIYKIYDWNTNK